MRSRLWIGVLIASLLAIPAYGQGGSFSAQIENFWRLISTGGRTFASLKAVDVTVTGTCTGCGGGIPGGSNTQIQFNDGAAFGGNPNETYSKVDQAAGTNYPIVIGTPESNIPAPFQGWWSPAQTLFTSSTVATQGFDQAIAIESVTDGTGSTKAATGIGVISAIDITVSNGGSSVVTGGQFEAQSEGTQNLQTLYGLRSGTVHNSSGTLADTNGIYYDGFSGAGGGAVTTSHGMFLGGATGTITNAYGLYIDNQTVAGSSLNYAIYYAAPSSKTFSVAANGNVVALGTITSTFVSQGSGLAVANVGANSCGTTAATVAGNDNAGTITVGATSGSQCRVTFAVAAPTSRECVATDETTTIATRATYIESSHTDILVAFGAGILVSYVCFAR